MPQHIQFEGTVHAFPDDFTQQEISDALTSYKPATQASTVDLTLPTAPAGNESTSNPSMFERVTGRSTGNLPFAKAARDLQVGLQGAGKGLANLAGMPGDVSVGLANLFLSGVDNTSDILLPKDYEIDLPRLGRSVVGSEAISNGASDVMRAAGVNPIEKQDMSPLGRLMYNVNQYGTEAMTGAAGLSRIAARETAEQTAQRAPRWGDALTNPYRTDTARTFANDAAAGAGAGAGITGAEEFLPEPARGPMTDFMAMLAGSAGGSALASGGRATKEGLRSLIDFLPDRKVPYSASDAGIVPVSRRTSDQTARFVQGVVREGGGEPDAVATQVGRRAQEFRDAGDPIPTTGILTDDIGLNAIERSTRVGDRSLRFQARDQQIRDAAQSRVAGLRDDGADPSASRRFIEQDVQAQRDAAQTPVAAARQDLEATQQENTAALSQAELQREKRLLDMERQVFELQRAADLAKQKEAEIAGRVQAPRGNETAASERLAGAIDTAKQVDEQVKGTLYRDAETLGRDANIDPTPLIDHAAAIRSDISRLSAQDPKLANILDDLDRLTPSKDEVITEVKGADGKLAGIEKGPAKQEPISAADLIAMRPRLSAARDAASKAYRGNTVKRIDELNDGIKSELDRLAESGDAAALKWREAEGNFRDNFAPKYREGIGGELDRASRGYSPVPSSAVASRFLKPGAGGKEAAEDLNRILKGAATEAAGKAAAREYVMADMARVVGADGKISPPRLRTWIANRAGMFEAAPELRTEAEQTLRDVVSGRAATTNMQHAVEQSVLDRKTAALTTQKEINDIKANNKLSEAQKAEKIATLEREASQVERDIQKSAASLLIDSDPAKAAARVFGSKDPRGAMREIVGKVAKDKEAAAGWKRSVVEHLIDKVTTTNKALTGGSNDGAVSVAQISRFMDENGPVLSEVFTPAEMNSLRRAQKMLEPFGNLSRRATAGSPTFENEQLWNSLDAGILAVTGNAITTGMVVKRLRVAAKFLPDGQSGVRTLVNRMMFDPELAQHLLTRNARDIQSPSWNKKLSRLIAFSEASDGDTD